MARLVERQVRVRVVSVTALAGQLGLRRFFRVRTDGIPATLIARVEAPEDPAGRPDGIPPEPGLEPLRSLLAGAGLPVAARLGGDPDAGIDLLEDFGDRTLEDAVQGAPGPDRRSLYRRVLEWVPRLQACADPGDVPAFGRRLDPRYFRYKAELFARHSLPVALGRAPRPAEVDALRRAFGRVAEIAAGAPARLAHRDLQSRNVLVDAHGPHMIDFQGALLAPPEYDLVCLLRDSYVELPGSEVDEHLARTLPALPDAPALEEARERFALLTLTRKAKDHARFLYAATTRGESRWLAHVPATVRALREAAPRAAALHPDFEPLAEWMLRLPESCAP